MIRLLPGLLFCFLCTSCGKKDTREQAHNHYKLAMLELGRGGQDSSSIKKSLIEINQALAFNDTADYLALKGTLLFVLGCSQESEQTFLQAIQLCTSPHLKTEILNNYACVLAKIGQESKALAIWTELEASKDYLTPEVCCVNQGKLFLGQGDIEKSKDCFSRAIRLMPQYVDAHYYLALAAHHTGDSDCARHEVKTTLFLAEEHQGAQALAKQLFG